MYNKMNKALALRQNSQSDEDLIGGMGRQGSFGHPKSPRHGVQSRHAAPILRVERTSIKITYYIAFTFVVYFMGGVLFDTLSSEHMSVFEVSKCMLY